MLIGNMRWHLTPQEVKSTLSKEEDDDFQNFASKRSITMTCHKSPYDGVVSVIGHETADIQSVILHLEDIVFMFNDWEEYLRQSHQELMSDRDIPIVSGDLVFVPKYQDDGIVRSSVFESHLYLQREEFDHIWDRLNLGLIPYEISLVLNGDNLDRDIPDDFIWNVDHQGKLTGLVVLEYDFFYQHK